MRRFLIYAVTWIALFIYSLNPCYALDVTLAWDANREPNLAGYSIYYGMDSGPPYEGQGASEGDSPVDVFLDEDEDPHPDRVQFTLHDLPEGSLFFAVTASNTAGTESGYSNEASATDPPVSTSNLAVAAGGGHCFISTLWN